MLAFNEPMPGVVLFRAGNCRLAMHEWWVFLHAQAESATHDSQLAVDRTVRGARLPTFLDIQAYVL